MIRGDHGQCEKCGLTGHAVFSDAPNFDNWWLGKLLAVAAAEGTVRIESIDTLLVAEFTTEIAVRAEDEANRLCPPTHRAAADVRHLLEIYRLAAGYTKLG